VAAAAIQEIMPNRMRGVASALLILAQNLLGLTLGPTGVALLTDYVFQDEMALGWSLVIMSVSALSIATVLFYFALRSAGRDDEKEVRGNILDS
jgi:MFS family permease